PTLDVPAVAVAPVGLTDGPFARIAVVVHAAVLPWVRRRAGSDLDEPTRTALHGKGGLEVMSNECVVLFTGRLFPSRGDGCTIRARLSAPRRGLLEEIDGFGAARDRLHPDPDLERGRRRRGPQDLRGWAVRGDAALRHEHEALGPGGGAWQVVDHGEHGHALG